MTERATERVTAFVTLKNCTKCLFFQRCDVVTLGEGGYRQGRMKEERRNSVHHPAYCATLQLLCVPTYPLHLYVTTSQTYKNREKVRKTLRHMCVTKRFCDGTEMKGRPGRRRPCRLRTPWPLRLQAAEFFAAFDC